MEKESKDLKTLMRPIGRHAELSAFNKFLELGKPLVAAIVGQWGVGKSTFMNMASTEAEARGWSVIDVEPITTLTTQKTFEGEIEKKLFQLSKRSFDKPWTWLDPATGAYREAKGKFEQSNLTLRQNPALKILKPAGEAARRTGEVADGVDFITDVDERTSPILRKLKNAAPLLIMVDGFQPGPQFGLWFMDFIKRIVASRANIIVLISDKAAANMEFFGKFSPFINENIALGQIGYTEVKQHFESLNSFCKLGMEQSEMDTYLKQAAKKPQVLKALRNVLISGSRNKLK